MDRYGVACEGVIDLGWGMGVVPGTVCHMGGRVDFTLWSRVRHWDRLFDSPPINGEGNWWVCLVHPRSSSPLDCGSSPQ